MTKSASIIETKVLPFDTNRGRVNAHAIVQYKHDWMEDIIEYVSFQNFDEVAHVKTHVMVHWTEFTRYEASVWPHGHTIEFVMLRNGRKIYTTSYSLHFPDDDVYNRSPLIARGAHRITTLQDRTTLIEVVGVEKWARAGFPQDTSAILDPFKRDNEEFAKRMAAAALAV